MESFADLINNRRSIRKFTNELLAPEQVELIVKAALKAPTSKNLHPWHFILVEDKEMLRKLSLSKKDGSAYLEHCALAIVVAADVTVSDVWVEDGSIAAIYMQLQAEDLGLGSCWCQIRNRQTAEDRESNDYVREVLEMPYQLDIVCMIGFGHKDQVRKPIDEDKLRWDKVHVDLFTLPEGKE